MSRDECRMEDSMDGKELASMRKKLEKTQKQMAELLGCSVKAIHSYEQEWRPIPSHIEKQVLFLVYRKRNNNRDLKPCWDMKQCPPEEKKQCPAWEFQAGKLCWFINGTICEGEVQQGWREKMEKCRACKVFSFML